MKNIYTVRCPGSATRFRFRNSTCGDLVSEGPQGGGPMRLPVVSEVFIGWEGCMWPPCAPEDLMEVSERPFQFLLNGASWKLLSMEGVGRDPQGY